jgi:hypothetical protein
MAMKKKPPTQPTCPHCKRSWRAKPEKPHSAFCYATAFCPGCKMHYQLLLPKRELRRIARTEFSFPMITCTACIAAEQQGYRNESRRCS